MIPQPLTLCCGVSLLVGIQYMVIFDIFIAGIYAFLDIWKFTAFMMGESAHQRKFIEYIKTQSLTSSPLSDELQMMIFPPAYFNSYSYIISLWMGIVLRLFYVIPVSAFFLLSVNQNDGKWWRINWTVIWLPLISVWSSVYILYFFAQFYLRPATQLSIVDLLNALWILYKIYELFVVFVYYKGTRVSKRLSMAIANEPLPPGPFRADGENPASGQPAEA